MKSRLCRGIAAMMLICLTAAMLPFFAAPVSALEPPTVSHAKSAYLYNFENDTVLFEYGEHEAVFPTAAVKLMTGLVAIDVLRDRMDERIVVTAAMMNEVKGNNISLNIGEVVSVRDMMYALLTHCANDAAYVLAYTAAGSAEAFVSMMNAKAAQLGAFETHYTNPTGMHDDKMVTSAYDTAIIAKAIYRDEVLSEMVGQKNYVMDATNMTQYRNIFNRNALIYTQPGSEHNYRYAAATGMNAGYTTQGGYSIVATAHEDGLTYLAIVMGAEEFEGEIYSYKNAMELLDWAFESYDYVDVLSVDTTVVELPVRLSSAMDYVTLIPEKTVSVYLPTDIDFDADIKYSTNTYDDYLNAPVTAGQVCGFVTVSYKDEIIASTRLVATSDVARSDFLYFMDKVKDFSKSTFFIAAVITAVVLTLVYIFIQATRTEKAVRRRAVRSPKRWR